MPLVRHLVFFRLQDQLPDGYLPRTLDLLDGLRHKNMPGCLYWRCHRLLTDVPSSQSTNKPHGFQLTIDSLFDSADSVERFVRGDRHTEVLQTGQLLQYVDRFIPVDYVLPDHFDVKAFLSLQQPPHAHRAMIVHPNTNVSREQQADIARQWEALEGQAPELLYVSCRMTGRVEDGGKLYPDGGAGEPYYTFAVDLIVQQAGEFATFSQRGAYKALLSTVAGMTDGNASGVLQFDWEC